MATMIRPVFFARFGRTAAPGQAEINRRSGRWVVAATWVYVVLVLATLALIRQMGERWWPATLLIFMPRWLFLPPILVLILAAGLAQRRRLWGLQGAIALVIVGPLMALALPAERFRAHHPGGFRLRIMTLNRGADGIDARGLIRLIEREQIQLICFQEGTSDPILKEYWKRGWTRTNFIASRLPIVARREFLPSGDGDRPYPSWRTRLELVRVRAESGAEFTVATVHLDTVRHGLEMLRAGDPAGLKRHSAWRGEEVKRVVSTLTEGRTLPLLVGGDFNLPSDSPMFAPVRDRFRVGFDEAGWGYGYTYPSKLPWVRIDHILASPEWSILRCWVGPNLGSDHLPLIAEVVLSDPPWTIRSHPR